MILQVFDIIYGNLRKKELVALFLLHISVLLAVPEVHFHALEGHAEIVKQLLDSDPNLLHVRNKYGDTALHEAIQNGREEVVNVLLEFGSDIGAVDNFGNTPLHEAAVNNRPELIRLLLQKGADLQAKNNYGDTPLHEAARTHSNEAISILLQKGADPCATNKNNDIPLDKARKSRQMLIDHMTDETKPGFERMIKLLDKSISILEPVSPKPPQTEASGELKTPAGTLPLRYYLIYLLIPLATGLALCLLSFYASR
ncbi:MAG: ankyrin repeat domain-containing protein [Sedimentisphaerales bacterium]|nr:ankyrin repeat domain-containing protein [Sedimentisphaerales bacterium]